MGNRRGGGPGEELFALLFFFVLAAVLCGPCYITAL